MDSNKAISISKKSFIISFAILLALIIFVGILSNIIPAGSYDRVLEDGREIINQATFHYTDVEPLPIWRWFSAPIEVLGSSDNVIIIAIIAFLLLIGGSINVLNQSNVLNAIIGKIILKFGDRKYLLIAVMLFMFMSFGAFIGIFEEVVPLVPIVIALCYSLGFDDLTGFSIVILGTGFGFSAAVTNPFTIGIAQELAELPVFSGALYRILIFLVTYAVLFLFIRKHAKKVEKININNNSDEINEYHLYARDKKLTKSVKWFGFSMIFLFTVLISGSFFPVIFDFALPLVGLVFLIAGVGAGLLSGIGAKKTGKIFLTGARDIAPAIILILMASSIKFIIQEAGVMDTILFNIANAIEGSTSYAAVAILFVIVFFMDFLIGSGSAKAFLIMPLIVPLADIIGVNRQIMVLAFQFGDGFSNVVFPTNAVLLISLGLASISYTKWIKWVFKLQLAILAICLIFLELAILFGYGPF